jgi:hypothetical protein
LNNLSIRHRRVFWWFNAMQWRNSMISEAQVNEAHRLAVAQSGPRKGHLKASCPPMGTLAAAYWQGCMMEINPHKVSIARLIFMSPEERLIFDAAQASVRAVVAKRKAA